jgi:hypothetical protein
MSFIFIKALTHSAFFTGFNVDADALREALQQTSIGVEKAARGRQARPMVH